MPRFLLRALLFVTIGLLPAWMLSQVSRAHPTSMSQDGSLNRLETVLGNLERIEAIAFGSSHARALDFDELDLFGEALALPWNDAREVEFQVRTLAPRMPNLRVAFLSLSYFTFHWSNEHDTDESLLNSRRLYYASTPFLRWMPGDLDNFVLGKTQMLARSDNWYFVVAPLLGRDEWTDLEMNYYEDMVEEKDSEQLIDHAERRVPRTLESVHNMLAADPRLPARNYAALSAAIRLLQRRGVRVVLFTPPYYVHYRALYQAEPTLAEMKQLAARLRDEHQVEYYDFSASELSFDETSFRDSDHLNFHGRARLTPQLAAAMGLAAPRAQM